jgi:hypothetical protein
MRRALKIEQNRQDINAMREAEEGAHTTRTMTLLPFL